jgi:hypothetical protein
MSVNDRDLPENEDEHTIAQMVPYLDVEVGKIIRIPASELGSDAIQVQIEGHEGFVWVRPSDLHPGKIQHPPFEEEIRELIKQIQDAFAEHRSLSLEEWEDGFRRDANPEREIAIWIHAARVYRGYAMNESSTDRREEIYRIIVHCLCSTPDAIWNVLRLKVLTLNEAKEIVNRYYGKSESS